MAILQEYQAKALKDLNKGSPDSELLQELCSATDYALRAMKVTAQALGQAMSTLVVQERHMWLNLVEMKDVEKASLPRWPLGRPLGVTAHSTHGAAVTLALEHGASLADICRAVCQDTPNIFMRLYNL